jgi:hypothetical protein
MWAAIPGLARLAVGLIGVFGLAIVGAWGMRWYDERPVTPAWSFRCCLVVNLKVSAPLKPAYVEGMADPNSPFALALNRCISNVGTLQASLKAQDASIRALGAAGRVAKANAEVAVQRSLAAKAKASASEGRILAAATDTSRGYCPSYEAVDKAFTRSLQ